MPSRENTHHTFRWFVGYHHLFVKLQDNTSSKVHVVSFFFLILFNFDTLIFSRKKWNASLHTLNVLVLLLNHSVWNSYEIIVPMYREILIINNNSVSDGRNQIWWKRNMGMCLLVYLHPIWFYQMWFPWKDFLLSQQMLLWSCFRQKSRFQFWDDLCTSALHH